MLVFSQSEISHLLSNYEVILDSTPEPSAASQHAADQKEDGDKRHVYKFHTSNKTVLSPLYDSFV